MSSSTMPYPREEDFVEISERLKVMRKQEASHYAVPDYLAAEWQQRLRDATSEGSEDGDVERDAIATTEDGGLRSQGANSAEGGNADPVSSSSAAGSASSSSSQITEVWREKNLRMVLSGSGSLRLQPRGGQRCHVVFGSLPRDAHGQSSHLPARRHDGTLPSHQVVRAGQVENEQLDRFEPGVFPSGAHRHHGGQHAAEFALARASSDAVRVLSRPRDFD
mmetsp:Transcript_6010/g.9952  ORF Transcript_6010/g.9952 Transcript_6010/m.9952 type:complete len:221 (+) Transcript_6010:153-815(+)